MESIIFNNLTDPSVRNKISELIKAANLLSDEVKLYGQTFEVIDFKRNATKLSFLDKVNWLLKSELAKENQDLMNSLIKSRDTYKINQKKNHYDNKVFIIYKQLEQSINVIFTKLLNGTLNIGTDNRFFELPDLIDNNEIAIAELKGWNKINSISNGLEAAQKKADFIVNHLIYPQNNTDGRKILVLGNEFFAIKGFNGQERYWDYHETIALANDQVYLHHCIKFPPLQQLNLLELKELKKKLYPHLSTFKQHLKSWVQLCGRSDDNEERIDFFGGYVHKAGKTFEGILEQDELVKGVNQNLPLDAVSSDVYIGELPLHVLFDYMKFDKQIDEATYIILSKMADTDSRMQRRLPVIGCTTFLVNLDEMEKIIEQITEKIENPTVMKTKKFISLD